MRTTVRLDDDLLRQARALAARTGRTLSGVIEDGLREVGPGVQRGRGARPRDVLHVSSSLRYDLMTAHDLGIENKVFVNRGHDPSVPYYGFTEIEDIGGLPAVVGL